MKFIKKAAALLLAFLMLLVPATALADETNVTDTTTEEGHEPAGRGSFQGSAD